MKNFLLLIAMVLSGSFGLVMAQDVVVADSTAMAEEVVEAVEASVEQDADSTAMAPAVVDFDELNVELPTVVELEREGDHGAGIAGTWEYQLNLAFNNSFASDSTKDGDASGGFEITGGYNFTKHWFLGISAGYLHDFGGVKGMPAGDCVEWLGVVQYRWNPSKKYSFYIMGRAGIMCNIANDSEAWFEGVMKDYTYPNYQYYEFQPGIIFRPTKNVDVRLALCYAYARPGKETEEFRNNTYEEHLMSIKVGFARRLTFGK